MSRKDGRAGEDVVDGCGETKWLWRNAVADLLACALRAPSKDPRHEMMARSVLLCASCAVAWLQPRGLRVFAGRRFAGEGDVGSPGPSVGEFSSLAQLEARLSAIEGGASSKLRHFYEPSLHSFMLEPGTTRNFSVTSSAICVETLLDGGVETDPRQRPVR